MADTRCPPFVLPEIRPAAARSEDNAGAQVRASWCSWALPLGTSITTRRHLMSHEVLFQETDAAYAWAVFVVDDVDA